MARQLMSLLSATKKGSPNIVINPLKSPGLFDPTLHFPSILGTCRKTSRYCLSWARPSSKILRLLSGFLLCLLSLNSCSTVGSTFVLFGQCPSMASQVLSTISKEKPPWASSPLSGKFLKQPPL